MFFYYQKLMSIRAIVISPKKTHQLDVEILVRLISLSTI